MGTISKLWQDNYAEIRRVLRLSVPVSIGLLLNRMITFLSVIFVGHLGPAELAAASLGSSLLNILGLAVMAGLAGAITTLSGQVQTAACSHAMGCTCHQAVFESQPTQNDRKSTSID